MFKLKRQKRAAETKEKRDAVERARLLEQKDAARGNIEKRDGAA